MSGNALDLSAFTAAAANGSSEVRHVASAICHPSYVIRHSSSAVPTGRRPAELADWDSCRPGDCSEQARG